MGSGLSGGANQQLPASPGLLQFNVLTVDNPEKAPSHVGSSPKVYVIVPRNEAESAVPDTVPPSVPKVDDQVPVMVEPVWFKLIVIGLMIVMFVPIAASLPVR